MTHDNHRDTQRQIEDRRASILESYRSGKTLRQVGAEHGLTPERIRQIMEDANVARRKPGESMRTQQRQSVVEVQERGNEIVAAYKALGSFHAAAHKVGLPLNAVRAYLTHALTEAELRAYQHNAGYSDAQKVVLRAQYIAQLQQAAQATGEPLTQTAYKLFAFEHGWRGPQTVAKLFGSWGKACDAAGVKWRGSHDHYIRRFSTDDCLEAVRDVAAKVGHLPTYREYLDTHTDMQPSGPLVRQRLGTWSEITLRLLEEQAAA